MVCSFLSSMHGHAGQGLHAYRDDGMQVLKGIPAPFTGIKAWSD